MRAITLQDLRERLEAVHGVCRFLLDHGVQGKKTASSGL